MLNLTMERAESVFIPSINVHFSDPNISGQPRQLAVHTCVYNASPADYLCVDFVTAYAPYAGNSKGHTHDYYIRTFTSCLLVMLAVVSVQLEI